MPPPPLPSWCWHHSLVISFVLDLQFMELSKNPAETTDPAANNAVPVLQLRYFSGGPGPWFVSQPHKSLRQQQWVAGSRPDHAEWKRACNRGVRDINVFGHLSPRNIASLMSRGNVFQNSFPHFLYFNLLLLNIWPPFFSDEILKLATHTDLRSEE